MVKQVTWGLLSGIDYFPNLYCGGLNMSAIPHATNLHPRRRPENIPIQF